MSQKQSKRTRQAKKIERPPFDGETTVHIQARINPRLVREYDAYVVFADYASKGNEDRWIVREALIALGIMNGNGWQPQEDVTSVALSAKAVKAVNQLSKLTPVIADFQALVQQLLQMDFSSLRYTDGTTADGGAVSQQLTQFEQSAKDVLGQAHLFEVEE